MGADPKVEREAKAESQTMVMLAGLECLERFTVVLDWRLPAPYRPNTENPVESGDYVEIFSIS